MSSGAWVGRLARAVTGRREPAVQAGVDRSLVHDVSRLVVACVAPAELPAFDATSKAYFADPRWVSAGHRRGAGPLGFGTGDAVLLVSPVVLVAVTEVVKYLATEVAGPAVVRGGSAVVRALRRLFHVDGDGDGTTPDGRPEPRLEVTAEQWVTVRAIAITMVLRHGLPADTADLIGDAVVGVGQAAGPTEQP